MTTLGWSLVAGGAAWMLLSVARYVRSDPLDVWGASMTLDMRWLAGAIVALVGLRLATEIGMGGVALAFLGAWLALIPLKELASRLR